MLGYTRLMEMGFDHDAWPRSQGSAAESSAVHGRLDWHGLRARFMAARAFRHVHDETDRAADKGADASFDRSTARALAHFEHALHGVNLDSSTDGKAPSDSEESVAGASKLGDRG